jgi:thiol-disulfide isomerase/thioredoxin
MRFALLLLLTACGAAQLRQPADVTLSLHEITCAECGNRSVDALSQQPGVAKVEFDRQRAELHVHFDSARIQPPQMLTVLKSTAVRATVGAGRGDYVAEQVFAPGADVQVISHGDTFDMATAKVSGKVTIVDFGARWCGPCKEVDKDMADFLPKNPGVALRKVDIGDWDTPVARQHLTGVEGLPYAIVLDKDGKQVAVVDGLHLDKLHAAISAAQK